MDVKIVRLMNGEEIIAKVSIEDGMVTVKNPAVIVPMGEQQLGMVPWLPHSEDKEISISEEKVVFTFNPLTDLANQYSTNFGSGLVVPPKSAVPVEVAPSLKFSGSD
tara:strand:+ start:2011 stop:2331 length:321 start_codon:yes stop_codon:yes gene_type:complete